MLNLPGDATPATSSIYTWPSDALRHDVEGYINAGIAASSDMGPSKIRWL